MRLHKKILRTVLEHKTQYLGAIVLIALGCLLFSVFNIMGTNVINNLAAFKSDNVQEDANFLTAAAIDDIPALEAEYNVLLEQRGAADYDYTEDTTLRVLSATEKVDLYAVVKGADLSGEHDILLDPEFAKSHKIEIGSSVEIFGEKFFVCGYVCTPDYIYPLKNETDVVKNPDAFGIAVISRTAFTNLAQGYWFYSVKFNGTEQDVFKRALEESNTVIKWVSQEENMRISFINGDIKGIKPMGTVLPGAILLVTCVLVAVVLWRLLKRELTQIGLFYALGYRKREILRHYLIYPLLISAAGGILGTLLGALLVHPFVAYVSTFYNLPVMDVVFDPAVLLLSILLPFLFLLPSSLLVITRALRMPPLQLLRGGVKKSKINCFERALKLRRFPFSTKFKIRELVRNIPRTILMLLGVVSASALLLLGFGTKDSLDFLISDSFNNMYQYEYIYTFNSLQTEEPAYGEMVSLSPFTIAAEESTISTVVYGIEKDAVLINLTDANGNKLDYSKLIITQALADRLDILPGDSITIQNKINMKTYTLEVGAVTEYYLGNFIYMPIGELNSMLGYPAGSYLELYSDKGLDISPASLLSSTSRQYIIAGYDSIVEPIRAMAGLIGLASFLIGLIILYVVTSLLIEENKDTISLLKILGYDKKRLYALMLNPYTVFVVLGYLLSVPLILYSLGLFFDEMTAEMNMIIPPQLTVTSILLGFIIIFLTYQLSKIMNRRKISKILMSDGFKSNME